VKILIDMNLSPDRVAVFEAEGWEALHWASVSNPDAKDSEILDWARENNCVVFTHDLDFGTMLFSKGIPSPSVIQVRAQETSPARIGSLVVLAIKQLAGELNRGALVTIDPDRARARVLPIT
jgi:predicted nuclease of predicted toxin-antitoxin system